MQPVGIDLPLHTVLTPADGASQAILNRIREAKKSVEIRAFLWRDDDAGNMLGEAVLAAADRGAEVIIHKDRIAAVYEYAGGNKQSFFHKRVDMVRGIQAWGGGGGGRGEGREREKEDKRETP